MTSIDPKNRTDLARLKSSIEWSVGQMKARREQRMRLLKKLVGNHYGEDGSEEQRPVNTIELIHDVYQRGLASHQPQAIVQTDFEELVPTASDFETVLNRRIKKINLRDSLNICATEALVAPFGVMCVGVAIDGQYDAGSVFAEPVLFPDLILDCNARSWDEMAYVGHYFYVPLDWIESNDTIDEMDRRKFLANAERRFSNGDQDWSRKSGEIYQDLICLQQIFLRHENRALIIDPESRIDKPLSNSEWTGPYCGPYLKLAFRSVPGNLFPLPPAAGWWDLDNVANQSFVKAFEESYRSKTVGLAMNGDDAASIKNAGDGEIVGVSDPNAVVERTFGGANQGVVAMANAAMVLLNKMAGNPDLIGGLAPSSGTLGQDQLLAQGASGRMKDYQATMTEFETEVVSSIAYWEWTNPTANEGFTKQLKGTKYSLPEVWSPDSRNYGDFFQMNFSVNPYSRVNRSPAEQAQFITQILEQVILPAIPYMQGQSPIDWEYFFKMLARYNNAPEINMLLNWPQGESIPGRAPEPPGKPNNTKRTYERVNTQGGARNPVDGAMEQLMSATMNGHSAEPAASY